MPVTYYRDLNGLQVQQNEATAARRTFVLEFPVTNMGSDGETVTITVSKGGAAFAATGGTTLTQISGACYKLVLAAADLDTLGDLALWCVGSTDTTVYTGLQVVTHDPYDLPAAIWGALVATYKATAGSFAKWVNDIRQATLMGLHVGDTATNTVVIHDTDGTTHLATATKTTAGTETTWTPTPLS